MEEEFDEVPILTTKRSLVQGMKHHVFRLAPSGSAAEQNVNLYDESQFERPVRLHRRDPKDDPQYRNDSEDEGSMNAAAKAADDKERERQETLRAERRAEREADQALIAPAAKSQKPKKDKPRREKHFVQSYSDNVNKQKNMAIRYEEKLPWHLEDFENKQTWRGAYETSLSENHVALLERQDASGRKIYQMLPMQKWYKFTRKNQYKILAYQEAETAMTKGSADPFVVRKARRAEAMKRTADAELEMARGLRARAFDRATASGGRRVKAEDDEREVALDADDIDFNAEEDFADDEEGPLLFGKEEEEEAKDSNDRVKKEQLEANAFEMKEQKDWDAEEQKEKEKREELKKWEDLTRNKLHKNEHRRDFEGADENEVSGSEDSEIERLKEEGDREKKLEEERKAAEAKNAKDKVASGASTGRSGTPNLGRPSRPEDARIKNLKRTGSPAGSDVSGNESSSRKKPKHLHGSSGLAVNGASISRPRSPANGSGPNVVAPAPQRPGMKVNLDPHARQRSPTGAGSGSDVEMSDGGTVRRKKVASGNASPRASRPTSPDGTQAAKKRTGKSLLDLEAYLDFSSKQPLTRSPTELLRPEEIEIIKAKIPLNGIKMQDFVNLPEIKELRSVLDFVPVLKGQAAIDSKTKVLFPKGQKPKTDAGASPV